MLTLLLTSMNSAQRYEDELIFLGHPIDSLLRYRRTTSIKRSVPAMVALKYRQHLQHNSYVSKSSCSAVLQHHGLGVLWPHDMKSVGTCCQMDREHGCDTHQIDRVVLWSGKKVRHQTLHTQIACMHEIQRRTAIVSRR